MNKIYDASQIKSIDLRLLSLEKALIEIEKRPELWLPKPHDLSHLRAFISGWLNSRTTYRDEELMMRFNDYVIAHYGEAKCALGWYSLISTKVDGGATERLKCFYGLYAEYLDSKSKK